MNKNKTIAKLSSKVLELEEEKKYVQDFCKARFNDILDSGVFKHLFINSFGEDKLHHKSTEFIEHQGLCFVVGLRDREDTTVGVHIREVLRAPSYPITKEELIEMSFKVDAGHSIHRRVLVPGTFSTEFLRYKGK